MGDMRYFAVVFMYGYQDQRNTRRFVMAADHNWVPDLPGYLRHVLRFATFHERPKTTPVTLSESRLHSFPDYHNASQVNLTCREVTEAMAIELIRDDLNEGWRLEPGDNPDVPAEIWEAEHHRINKWGR